MVNACRTDRHVVCSTPTAANATFNAQPDDIACTEGIVCCSNNSYITDRFLTELTEYTFASVVDCYCISFNNDWIPYVCYCNSVFKVLVRSCYFDYIAYSCFKASHDTYIETNSYINKVITTTSKVWAHCYLIAHNMSVHYMTNATCTAIIPYIAMTMIISA